MTFQGLRAMVGEMSDVTYVRQTAMSEKVRGEICSEIVHVETRTRENQLLRL